MSSSSSPRSSQSVAGLATSAAQIVVTSALLARKKFARRTTRFDEEASQSLIAIDEDEQVVDFEKKGRSPRTSPTLHEMHADNSVDSPGRSVYSTTSSLPSEAPMDMSVASIGDEPEGNPVFISNMHYVNVGQSRERSSRISRATTLASSLIPGTSEHIEFYLPLLGPDNKGNIQFDASVEDPTALRNILRPWQVEFLQSLGIVKAAQFLKVKKKRDLSRDMKVWRKKNNLKSVKNRSRKVALHIWAKTCKSVIASYEKQKAEGRTFEKPAILKKSVSAASIASSVTASTTEATDPANMPLGKTAQLSS